MKVIILLVLIATCLVVRGAPQNDASAVVVKSNFDSNLGGYSFEYETSNGIQASENGQILNQGAENEGIAVQGQYRYVAPDGVAYSVQYTADENGFRPQGDHLPTLP
ncbi:flexible cuticle protein 12-like [Onthophagus taurus]|uniref:flexible cuticle protein 12-like n=1 Tax=Onthophagus taurus TaxID=166361 RepID=UPI000C20C715|nr:flexible cuticle protein 12-like [Onthophagus taurus]